MTHPSSPPRPTAQSPSAVPRPGDAPAAPTESSAAGVVARAAPAPDQSDPVAAPADAKAEREARLAAALRENLKRRKSQARARRDTPSDAGA